MAITDDAVRERHGMRCTEGVSAATASSVTIWEGDALIGLDSSTSHRYLTAYQARYLAAKLYRLSRRIRARTEPE